MRLDNIKKEIDILLDYAIEMKEDLYSINYRYISDYYRIRSERSINEDNAVVLNALSEYPDVSIKITMEDISDQFDDTVLTRDSLIYLKDWAYRYGSKGSDPEDIEVPDVGDETHKDNEIVYDINDRIHNDQLTVNDATLALMLAERISDRYGHKTLDGDVFDSKEYNQVMEILTEMGAFIEMKDDGRLNWDMMASTIETMRQISQENLIERSGERNIIRRLKSFEGDSIDKFLDSLEEF